VLQSELDRTVLQVTAVEKHYKPGVITDGGRSITHGLLPVRHILTGDEFASVARYLVSIIDRAISGGDGPDIPVEAAIPYFIKI